MALLSFAACGGDGLSVDLDQAQRENHDHDRDQDHDADAERDAGAQRDASAGRDADAERDAAQDDEDPLYAIASMRFGNEGEQFSYIVLLPTLDRSNDVTLKDAIEFPGYAPTDPYRGQLLVSSGEEPSITAYTIDGAELERGETISFARYTSEPINTNIILGEELAYAAFDGTNFAYWNPKTFEIEGEIGAPDEIPLLRGELELSRGYAYSVRGTALFQPYYWATPQFNRYSEISQISVIDTEKNELVSVLDAPCPHLHIASQDEAGNIYLSNGQGSISAAVLDDEHPRNCFLKIPAGQNTIDEASITHFADLTDGREGSNIFYVGEGLALFNVYHAERDDFGDDPEFQQVDYSASYHLWTLDLETHEAKLMEGIDYSGGQFVVFPIDDRVFLTLPSADYSTTEVYEIVDGRAEKRFNVEGWAFKMFRVR